MKILLPVALVLTFSATGCGNEQKHDKVSSSPENPVKTVPVFDTSILIKKDSGFSLSHEKRVTNARTAQFVKQVLVNKLFENELQYIPQNDRRFMFDEIDLNGDHKNEIFVGLSGPYFCGRGGCTAFVLTNKGKVITKFTVAEFPIIVRPSTTLGWRDLVIGSGAAKPSMHLIKWNGTKYPGNPSIQPNFNAVPSEKSIHVLSCSFHADHWFDF